MNVERDPTQQQFYDETVAFAQAKLVDDVVHRDLHAEFSSALWATCANHGVLKWAIPTTSGGAGLSTLSVVHQMEALGYGCRDNGLTFALGAQIWGIQMALLHFGNNRQKETYLGAIMEGKGIAAFGMTEPNSGSDAFALETTAVANNDGYLLNGEKVLVTLAPNADFAIIFAKTAPEAGRWGISAFIVDADTPGYRAHSNEPKMGLRTVPFGRISLDNCRIGRDSLLGKEGAGASIFSYSQGWERSLVLAPQIGAMQYQLEECIQFAKQRRSSDQAIGGFQGVSHRIADMKIRLETARLSLYRTAHLLQTGKHSLMEAAMCKLLLSEAFVDSSHDAIAIHGGAGYLSHNGIERNLRDAIGATLYGGTANIQRNIIAGLLGLPSCTNRRTSKTPCVQGPIRAS